MRDAVEDPYGFEIRIDSLTTPVNEIGEPALPSVMQLLLNVPGNHHICFDVPLVLSLYDPRPVKRCNIPRIRCQEEIGAVAGN